MESQWFGKHSMTELGRRTPPAPSVLQEGKARGSEGTQSKLHNVKGFCAANPWQIWLVGKGPDMSVTSGTSLPPTLPVHAVHVASTTGAVCTVSVC